MSDSPKAIVTDIVGGVEFGIYPYEIKSDDGKRVLESGFHIATKKEAAEGYLETQDPDINVRIGYSEPRGGAVAIAGGNNPASPLNEDEQNIAAAVMKDLQKRLDSIGIKHKATHPEALLETAFDYQEPTSLFVKSGSTEDKELLKKAFQLTADECDLKEPWKVQEKPARKPAATAAILEKKERPQTPEHLRLEAIMVHLNAELPGDENKEVRARLARRLMEDINLGAGQPVIPFARGQ